MALTAHFAPSFQVHPYWNLETVHYPLSQQALVTVPRCRKPQKVLEHSGIFLTEILRNLWNILENTRKSQKTLETSGKYQKDPEPSRQLWKYLVTSYTTLSNISRTPQKLLEHPRIFWNLSGIIWKIPGKLWKVLRTFWKPLQDRQIVVEHSRYHFVCIYTLLHSLVGNSIYTGLNWPCKNNNSLLKNTVRSKYKKGSQE